MVKIDNAQILDGLNLRENVPLLLELKDFDVSPYTEKDKPSLVNALCLLGSYARTKRIEYLEVSNMLNLDLRFVSERKGRDLTCYLYDKKIQFERNTFLDGRDMYKLIE